MTPNRIKSVLIVGGGTAGWMAAAALSRFLGETIKIQLVESEQIGTVGVGEATIPQIKHLNSALSIDEREFVARTNGSFKLGIEFINWRRQGEAYLHNFGSIGLNLQQVPFHHYWLRARAGGASESLWDYCLNTAAARQMRFAPLEKVGNSPLSGIAYAYHFDASLYGKFLRDYAEQRDVIRVEGLIDDTIMAPESGHVTAVRLRDGRTLEADLFIDCSGFRGLLIEQALKTGYEDWAHWLPCDRAIPVPSSNAQAPIRPYTQAIAHNAGWQWRIPLQHRTGNGHVFSSAHMSEAAATETLLANLEGEALAEPRVIRFVTGRRKQFWNRNVVALGLASGFLEPLESTSIHLVQSGISRLIALFPDGDLAAADRDEYNRQMALEYERVRDFIILHYHLNERTDSDFWQDCAAMSVPDTLSAKLDLFRANGRLYHREEDLFTDSSWLQVMLGQGVNPKGYHPMADALAAGQLSDFLGNIQKIVGQAAATLPTHSDFLAKHCPAAMDS
ncbi:tryptophan halogenase family protein [Maricaulis maris]|uniref:Tryptophan halogenase n=1 Tax=Maricaulis maris TaxID=74318 RepID=A0A495CXW5_9PROT|nr:tryptophan halogenase family protein [Maricaulis maris]RKQ94118.1 tryptophan halogenase [Maricaulis maris]